MASDVRNGQYDQLYNQRTLALNYGIRTFEVRDRFNYKNATLDWTFGRLWLDYSPYILTLTDDERGRFVVRHGASLSNIPFAGGTLACFVFPDGQNFAWGGRHRLTLGPATMNTTLFYLQRKFALVEQDFAYALSYKLPKGNFVLDLAQQKQQTGREAQTLLLTYESGSAPVSYKLSYFNFSPDFDPPYRDKMPQYSTATRSLTRWNVVDRYRGKKGAGLTLNLKEDTFGATGELETWQETSGRKYRFFGSVTSKVLDYTASASVLNKGHQLVNQYGTKQYFQDYFRFETGLKKAFKLPLPLMCGFNYELEKYEGQTNTIREIYGEYTVAKSYFNGLKLKLGWEHNSRLSKPRAYFETRWTLPNRVNLLYRHYTADLPNPSPYYDPVRERYLDYDNQLYITFSASFLR